MSGTVRPVAALPWFAPAVLAAAGCHHTITVEPITVEPIHLTLDITVKVDRELDEFFDFQAQPQEPAADSETAPAAGGDQGGLP